MDQRNARMQWELILNEMTNVTGEVFLTEWMRPGHDHKFDPFAERLLFSSKFPFQVWWPEDQNIGPPDQMAKLRQWKKKQPR